MLTHNAITSALIDVGDTFKKTNELAYLALTGKVERPIQNRLAYNLHLKLLADYVVAREWKGIDIAIFPIGEKKPVALIELKAMVNFDGHFQAKKFSCYMLNDERKARDLSATADVYSLLLTAHPLRAIPEDYVDILKYCRQIRRAYLQFHNPEDVIAETLKRLREEFIKREVVEESHFSAGEAFGVAVDIHYCLVKAPPANPS